MIAKKLRKRVMPPKRIWALGTQILFPYNLRAYRAWEIAGTQDTAPDTKTILLSRISISTIHLLIYVVNTNSTISFKK